jgi:hypothetical protein
LIARGGTSTPLWLRHVDRTRWSRFDLIARNLRRTPAGTRVVVEAFRLLPRVVALLLTDAHRAV